MKKDKKQEARGKKLTELNKDLTEAKEKLMRIKLEILTGKIKNTRAAKNLRREIAQRETLIKAKEGENKND